ncbi:MAG: c-type cytochrome biogenesis protein CcmI [Roseivivax sp.]|nr:c-type cytochrome biogenesis protein CcmI [Roseivivax sp.]
MTLFWIVTAALSLAVALLLARALLRGRRDTGPAQAFDIQVYRDQLKDVERDLARGVIEAGDAERVRTEISRRILAADSAMRAQGGEAPARRGPGLWTAVVSGLVMIAGSFGLYWFLGAPGYGDLSLKDRIAMAAERRQSRPSQAEAEASVPAAKAADAPAEYTALVERLRSAVANRPDDLQGHMLLARAETALGNYAAAYKAQERILAIKGDAATAQDYADLAGALVIAAGGYVSPEAERALDAALSRDAQNGTARYYGGLMMAQIGRPDVAFSLWRALLTEGPADAPWMGPIREQIEELAWRAGEHRFQLPPEQALPGPSQADMANAAEMSDEDRQAMIRGMVDRLSDRLASEGGTPEEWARLIGALGVLGDTDRAKTIWAEAQTVFAGKDDALATIRAAAEQAGVAE